MSNLRKNLEDFPTVKERTVKAFKDFPSKFRGLTLRPEDAGYAKAREIYNMRRDDDTPAMIARAVDSDDVVVLMRYASEKGIPVAIRSGGHSSDGTAMPDGALVLDMTAMTTRMLDRSTCSYRAESGMLL